MTNSPARSGSLGRCPRKSVPYANHLAAHQVSLPVVRPPITLASRRAMLRLIVRRVTLRRWQRVPRFGWASPQLTGWCRRSTRQSRCARHPNSAQPQSVGLPSKCDLVRRSNWFGRQPNFAPFQTSNLTRSQPLRPMKSLMKSHPLMKHSPRILMTNRTSTANQTPDQKNWCRPVRRTPPPACSPWRLRRRARALERQRGQCAEPLSAKR
jgi:hypothetical protein